MAVPFLLFLLALVLFVQREPPGAPAPPPDVASPDETVEALIGELEGAQGWLVARLSPLHAAPARQAFESATLQRRLELTPGQPWRLSVQWSTPEGEPGAAPRPSGAFGVTGPARGEGPASDGPAGIGLGALRVEDEAGVALFSFGEEQRAGSDGPASPLRTLLGPPSGAVSPGETADWILWGRAPGAGARLVGLVPEDDPEFLAATGFGGAFPLRATRVRRGDMNVPLARLERGEPGKNPSSRPSQSRDALEGPQDR